MDPGVAGPERSALPRHRGRDRRRHRGRKARSRRSPAAATNAGRAAFAGLHHGRARLCRGGEARARRIDRRPRDFRPPRRDGARRAGARPLAGGLFDEHAAGAGRSGAPRPHARRLRERRSRPRDASALPGLRRIASGSDRRRGLARTARAGAVPGAHLCRAGRARRHGRHLQPARQSRRSGPVRSDHLSGRPFDRRAARASARRRRDGPRRRHSRGAGGSRPRRTRRRRSTSIRPCRTRRRSPSPSAGAPRSARSPAGTVC